MWRKEEHFAEHFVICIFFRMGMFSWLFSWFFRIINAYQFFFTLNILIDKVDPCEVETKKKAKYHLYPNFLKNFYRWPKLMASSYTCREVPYRKKMTLDIWPSRKYLKCLLQNTYLKLDLLYHKCNLLITTVVDGSIF